jgi:hypothetical protein
MAVASSRLPLCGRRRLRVLQIMDDAWRAGRVVERQNSPGPAEYALPDAFKQPTRGGIISAGSRREVDFEWDMCVTNTHCDCRAVFPLVLTKTRTT